jgi:2-methylcitrate dehydratase PrpD
MVDARLQDFPPAVIRKAALCLLDSIGCSMAGSHSRRGDILYSLLTPVPQGGVQILGRQFRTTPYEAVFYNALTANFLELDDSYDRSGSIMFAHPGANVVPPMLALAQMRGASGQDVLEAIVVGYETCLRVGAAIQPSYRRATEEVWGCATFQTFGSVAAAAKLLKLDLERTLNALGIAGATAPVSSTLKVWRDDHPDMHNGYGWAAETGLRAALIAERGYTAPQDILDGNNGFWRMYGSDQCDFALFTEGLGKHYAILDVAFKPWPACRWAHPVMDAGKALTEKQGLRLRTLEDIERVRNITVRLFAQATRHPYANYKPRTLLEGQFSTPFCAAAALLQVWPEESLFRSGGMNDARLPALMEKVKLEVDPDAEAAFPGNGGDALSAGMTVETLDGTYDTFITVPFGDRRNPMELSDLIAKFHSCNANRVAKAEVSSIADAVMALCDDAPAASLLAMLSHRSPFKAAS